MRCPDVRGFNYDGSWGTSALDLWQHHQHGTMAVEIARGKRYFPGWNVARWWLSHESFQRAPARFLADFDAGLSIFASHDILVMPLLFNRWRDPVCDFGGVPLDHIIPGANFANKVNDLFHYVDNPSREPALIEDLFRQYLEGVVGTFADDRRVFAWDLCNEPLMGSYVDDPDSPVRQAEVRWLKWCYDVCKSLGAKQPLTIGNFPNLTALRLTAPMSDFLSFHPYYMWNDASNPLSRKPEFEGFVGSCQAIAEELGKDLLANETVWGSQDDAEHVEVMRYTLGVLAERGIGFVVHALHHSLVADLHTAGYGPVGLPGCLHFINPDGSLRAGHEAFNEFAGRAGAEGQQLAGGRS